MAFAVTSDLRCIVLAIYRETRKHENLLANPRVSLLIDNRPNKSIDYHDAVAISAQGTVSEVDWAPGCCSLYFRKHPQLREFATATDCVLLKLEVESYYVVSQFQNVAGLRMT